MNFINTVAFALIIVFSTNCTNKKSPSDALGNSKKENSKTSLQDPPPYRDKVIYGKDNRKDFYEIEEHDWQNLSRSTVAIIDSFFLKKRKDHFKISGPTYKEFYDACPEERFLEQKSVAHCSGSLIAEDTVLTAGHCIESQEECKDFSFVFDFLNTSENQTLHRIPKDKVYSCAELIYSHVEKKRGSDFAVIKLDRAVKDRPPLSYRTSGKISNRSKLVTVGYPAGLPLKWVDGARVRSNFDSSFFVANLDSYMGNSGSPVFNAKTKIIEGVLVRGEADFIDTGKCLKSIRCNDRGCKGEDVQRMSEILPFLKNQ